MIYEKWKPIQNIVAPLKLIQLLDNNSGFNITLQEKKSPKDIIIIDYHGMVFSYRATKTNSLINKFISSKIMYGEIVFSDWPFYQLDSSNYLDWLDERFCDFDGGFNIKHHIFITTDYTIEILSSYLPTIKLIKKD